MTLTLWSRIFLYVLISTTLVYSRTEIDSRRINGNKNVVFEKESRGELEPLATHLENTRPNSRYPSNSIYYPRPYYSVPPFFGYHVEDIENNGPRPYLRPAPVVINNHRPQSYTTTTSLVNNHSPLSTRRPLPTNQPDIIRNLTFGLVYPQLHIIPSQSQQNNQNVVSSNSIDFIEKPSEDTTVVYSDVIVIKKPFGEGGDVPESLTIFTSRNESNSQTEVSTDLSTFTTPYTINEETTTLTNEDIKTEVTTIQPIVGEEEDFEEEDSDTELISVAENSPSQSSISTSGSTHLTSFRPPPFGPPPSHSLIARPLAQRLLIAIPSVLVALGLLVLLVLI